MCGAHSEPCRAGDQFDDYRGTGLAMSGNDHSDCPVELRPCAEHEFEQKQSMSEEALPAGLVEIMFPPDWQRAALP